MINDMKQYEVLKRASLFLEKNNSEKHIAELLLQHHLGVSRSKFYSMMQEDLSKQVVRSFTKDLETHVKTHVPVQHLLGYEYFYGRKFSINKHVLIPRPETEELVQHVIHIAEQNKNKPLTIVDVGTGSGVIAITLALELPQATIIATDISKEALEVAKQNTKHLKANVQFLHGSFLQPMINLGKQADIIVSNPPYIAESERPTLSKTVKNFDPDLALFAEDGGLAAYKSIITEASQVVRKEGFIAFEIGYQQGEAVRSLINKYFPKSDISIIQDINKKDRIVSANI